MCTSCFISDASSHQVPQPADHDVPDEFIISGTDCEQKLSKLCVHKAMGPDNIPNWILKDFSYIVAAPIAAIYNSSMRQSYVPPSWKQAEILPIPKVSQVTSLAKHVRPIALTPVLSKALESFVVSWMRRATVHSETQYGGIKDSSTTCCPHHDVTPCAPTSGEKEHIRVDLANQLQQSV